jgi:hypothetical protein
MIGCVIQWLCDDWGSDASFCDSESFGGGGGTGVMAAAAVAILMAAVVAITLVVTKACDPYHGRVDQQLGFRTWFLLGDGQWRIDLGWIRLWRHHIPSVQCLLGSEELRHPRHFWLAQRWNHFIRWYHFETWWLGSIRLQRRLWIQWSLLFWWRMLSCLSSCSWFRHSTGIKKIVV